MRIQINREQLVNSLLKPIGQIAEQATITVEPDKVYTLCSSPDNGVILYAKIPLDQTPDSDQITEAIRLNLGNVKKLSRALEAIPSDFPILDVNSNNIVYSSSHMKFKYHLLDDAIIQRAPISLKKLDSFLFDCEFELTANKLSEILKGSSFATDTNKIYFYTKDSLVYADLCDQQLQNTDSITFLVSGTFSGSELKTQLPMNLEAFRVLSSATKNSNINIKINTALKVVMFHIVSDTSELKYIVAALVK